MEPLQELANLWAQAKAENRLKQKTPMCLTAIDSNGFPNSRFLDLKKVTNEGLIFCASLSSNKISDLEANPKCGIGIWWEHISTQIRINGTVKALDEEISNKFLEK